LYIEQELKKIKIVSVVNEFPQSNIANFPKMSYKDFYDMLEKDKTIILQSMARDYMLDKLGEYNQNG
jgi:hypothetical protein